LARLTSETINPFLGVLEFQARNLASAINLPRDYWGAFVGVAQNLFRCFVACDAVRAEINPLGLMPGGELVALGGDIMIDDNALFRQPELVASRVSEAERDSAALTRVAGLTYVRLGGNVGCAVSGAGLGLATLDMLARNGCSASGFLDMGSIHRDSISAALRLILPGAKVGLFNIFADRASCAELAHEFLAALADVPLTVPLVIRLAGRDADQGLQALDEANVAHLTVAADISEAVRLVAAAAKGFIDVNLSR
jgi:succinyl-CoA synthetase beta subunit